MPRSCHFVIPGDWRTPTGGYRYDRRIAESLREGGWQVDLCALGDRFPWPDAATLAHAQAQLDTLPDGALVVADGLAFGAMPELAHRHAARLRWVALVHHPLHLETGLTEAARSTLRASECKKFSNLIYQVDISLAEINPNKLNIQLGLFKCHSFIHFDYRLKILD